MRLAKLIALLALLIVFAPAASADIAVLLEEPYSYDGALAGTGHTAVYFNRVCAASPTVLRRCKPGEHGAVISRYTRIAEYDWVAIPLIPYLYAVEDSDSIPLYADSKLVLFLRDQYRRAHLEDIAPDTASGEAPKGDWVQLIGSSYDRTSYGFQMETTADQDDAFIAWFNSRPNRITYQFVSRNCADFVRDVVNFYYPRAVSRGSLFDLWVETPKHAAKSFIKYQQHHPDLPSSRFVIPQIPGTMKRSRPIRGVLESLFRAKKYVLALAIFHPVVAGSVASASVLSDRFQPARGALVLDMDGNQEEPLTRDQRREFLKNLGDLARRYPEESARRDKLLWRQFQENAQIELSASGRTIRRGTFGTESATMGISRGDLIKPGVPSELQRGLLVTRIQEELAGGRSPKVSRSDLLYDWQQLQRVTYTEQQEAANRPDIASH